MDAENYACSIKNVCEIQKSNDTQCLINCYLEKSIKSIKNVSNQYVCNLCEYMSSKKSSYDNHLSSKKHAKNYALSLKNVYTCEICDYTTSIKCNYNKHLSSKSHIHRTQQDNQSYSSIMDELKNMMLEQTTKMREEQTKIIEEKTTKIAEEQAKMNQIITEIANKPVSNIVSNNTNISNNTHNNENNNHFNLNMFLNETCKDAMNISDFMKNLTVTMEDMELTGKLGFVKGMTRIIVNNLNALEVCKRPIHCSDAKRETLYVKNNGVWEKETDDKKFTKALIRSMRDLSDIQLSKWRYLPKNKGYERYDHHKNSEFLILVYEIHQFREEEIDKLIRNIIRHVVIDKSLYARSSQII
jgi:hypothetical protein